MVHSRLQGDGQIAPLGQEGPARGRDSRETRLPPDGSLAHALLTGRPGIHPSRPPYSPGLAPPTGWRNGHTLNPKPRTSNQTSTTKRAIPTNSPAANHDHRPRGVSPEGVSHRVEKAESAEGSDLLSFPRARTSSPADDALERAFRALALCRVEPSTQTPVPARAAPVGKPSEAEMIRSQRKKRDTRSGTGFSAQPPAPRSPRGQSPVGAAANASFRARR